MKWNLALFVWNLLSLLLHYTWGTAQERWQGLCAQDSELVASTVEKHHNIVVTGDILLHRSSVSLSLMCCLEQCQQTIRNIKDSAVFLVPAYVWTWRSFLLQVADSHTRSLFTTLHLQFLLSWVFFICCSEYISIRISQNTHGKYESNFNPPGENEIVRGDFMPVVHLVSPPQTPTCCGTSSWQRWRWARAGSGTERVAKRPRANPRPFDPSWPFHLWPYEHRPSSSLSKPQPPDSSTGHRQKRQTPSPGMHIKCCLHPPPFSPSGAVVHPAPLSQTVKQTWEENNGECCIILMNQCGGMRKELQNIHMKKGTFLWLSRCLKNHKTHFFCFCSLALFSSAFFLLKTISWG